MAEPSVAERSSEVVTDRTKERAREDDQYVPVIIKRSDEGRRHPDDTLELAVQDGLEQIKRGAVSLALSAMAGGLILGFTVMAVGVAARVGAAYDLPLGTRLMTALFYPLGFVICVLSGAQLFTEHTAIAVYPVLDRKASLAQLLRLWLIVIAGNVIGAAVIAALLTMADPVIEAREGYLIVGRHLVTFPWPTLLVSAMLAGWLMAQGAWLVAGTPATTGQMFSVYIVTFLIGIGGLHHSIAGAVELFTALWMGAEITFAAATAYLGLALLGNLVGGSIFVAILNYTHVRRTQAAEA